MNASIPQVVRRALGVHDRVVLAVSGGIDSMVMLDAAVRVLDPRRILVATFDHGTGPAASAAGAHVVRWCDGAGVACVNERAGETLATEEDFRDARWRFLRDVATRSNAMIATAHTADDHIETVLMRILRGAGARGIAGLFAASDVLRPLLGVSRRQVASYARRRAVEWIEDPTNQSRRHFRNRIRHDLLPALSAVRPRLREELISLSSLAAAWRRDVDAFVRRELDVRVLSSGGVDVGMERLAEIPPEGLGVVWPAIASMAGARLDRRAIARLVAFTADASVGSRIPLAGGWEVVRSRDALQLRASGQVAPGESVLPPARGISWGAWSIRPTGAAGLDAWSAWLPSDAVLTIRPWRPGDVLVVRPGKGARQRKVKVMLSKAGVTGHERAGWPVVLSGEEIVWVPGVGRSDAATVRSGRPVLAFVCEHSR